MASKKVGGADALQTAAAALGKGEVQQLGFDPLVAKRACRKGLEVVEEYKKVLVALHSEDDRLNRTHRAGHLRTGRR